MTAPGASRALLLAGAALLAIGEIGGRLPFRIVALAAFLACCGITIHILLAQA